MGGLPAAFRRLCVETLAIKSIIAAMPSPAAFRRLCVETFGIRSCTHDFHPAAFRRLCVETLMMNGLSRLNCQPPSGGCVLKLKRLGTNTNV